MPLALDVAAAAGLALLSTLTPALLLLLLFTACANENRTRLTAMADRFHPLRLLLWAGVATHEAGHALMCLGTLTRIRQMQVRWHSGFVKHDARGPVVSTLIACGPIVSATLLSVAATAWLFGTSFALAAGPFRAPFAQALDAWTQSAARSLFHTLVTLIAARWYVNLPLLLALGGTLSSAAPSPPDLRNAAPGLLWMALAAWAVEGAARALGFSYVAALRPLLHDVTGALGIAAFACLLSAAVIVPLSIALCRR